jgi:exopolysaccharide production protein ExoQ
MPPTVALFIWLVLLLALLCFDPAKDRNASFVLWVPVIWLCIAASRLPSQWIGYGSLSASQALQEGNSLDRVILSILIAVAIGTLMSRSFQWKPFLSRNLFLTLFLIFALVSVFWSDFPLISLKRWFRDFGNYLIILVILSDHRPLEAVRTVLRRLCYLLIPLSIVLIKYYPQFGIQYETWSGARMYAGATTSKNMLGALCLVSGIFFFWDTVTRWCDRNDGRTRRILLVNSAFIGMTVWLLHLASSATSTVCFLIGCSVIWCTHSRAFKRHPSFFKASIALSFPVYLIVAFVFGLNADIVKAIGRNPTLTDRTFIWRILLSTHTNPLTGVGYDSFWLGSRLHMVWRYFPGITEAHNGYLDIYLDLGVIGLVLLVLFLFASYRIIWKTFSKSPEVASLSLAAWGMLVFYNMTEAAFKGGLIWLTFLLGALSIAERIKSEAVDALGPRKASGWQSQSSPVQSYSSAAISEKSSAIQLFKAQRRS